MTGGAATLYDPVYFAAPDKCSINENQTDAV
jgi:hypothetical protein